MHPGSNDCYTNRRCREPGCREAHRLAGVAQRAARAARLLADPSSAEHGKDGTYTNCRCRCDDCRAAHSRAVTTRRRARAEDERLNP